MRPISFGNPPAGKLTPQYIMECFRKIQTASRQTDMTRIAENFTITNLTERRSLDWSTATAAEKSDLLATFIADVARGGPKGL